MIDKRFPVTFFLILICNIAFSQQPIKVACLGNSVTYGYLHKSPALTSYPAQLQQLLGTDYNVKNFGHSGATLFRHGHNPYSKTNEFEDAIVFHPDIAIIDLGLNDTDPRDWPNYRDEFLSDYTWLIDTLRRTTPGVKIFICKMTPIFNDHPRFKSGTRDWFWQIQNLIPQIAAVNKTGLIDFHSPLYSRPDLFPDALHPNEAGASILAATVYQKLTGNYGGLKLAPVFASHMVLQRNKAIHFYGTANANEKIVVSFNGKKETCTANENGKWDAQFPAMQAGGPYTASVVAASGSATLEDVLIGEVWLCSGQSNMYFKMRSALKDKNDVVEAEKSSTLRLLRMEPFVETDNYAWEQPALQKVNELAYYSGTWQKCDSTSVKEFSAVAYYYGRKLQSVLKVPVGLIQVAMGGSTTESWIDRYTMEHHAVLVNELTNWRKSDFFQPWVRERADTNLKKSDNPKQRHPYEPCYNFEAGIKPFVGFPIAGVIWYQGESNAHNIELHETVFPELVKSWRSQWGYNFPFYYVQLSSINRPSWPAFRYSQLQMLKVVPNAGMAVTSDLGDSLNVHYPLKKPVGERLANLALHFSYGRKDVLPYGPLPLKAVLKNDEVIVSFQYASHLQTKGKEPLKGFKILDEYGNPIPSHAFIKDDKVVIQIETKARPTTVLYAWEPYTRANLENGAALPASTFKLDIH